MIEFGYVYILASGFKRLYIGVTSELELRIMQHKAGFFSGSFTDRYNIHNLVYFERFGDMSSAIAREKQLKRWSRVKKIRLIVAVNPDWRDLSEDWGKPGKQFDRNIKQPVRFTQDTVVSPLRSTIGPSNSGRDDELLP